MPKTSQPSCIVGIGGAAGARDAYLALLHALPATTGMAFAIVSNIHFAASTQLVQVLSKHTKMRVLMAAPEMPIRANHVYVVPTSLDIQFDSYSFKHPPPPRTPGWLGK